MAKQPSKNILEISNDEAINKIYEMFNRYNIFKRRLNNNQPIARKELTVVENGDPLNRDEYEIKSCGRFGFVNPGPKDIKHVYDKLLNKTFSDGNLSDQFDQYDPMILNTFHDRESDLFDKIRDWTRFSIILPDFSAAPAAISYFLTQFGGQVSVHDKKEDKREDYEDNYEAYHIHTTYKDVNLEIQFHTQDYLEAKKATDIFYHTYHRNNPDERSALYREKKEQETEMTKYVRTIYDRSDFKENKPKVIAVNNEYQARGARPERTEKLSHFMQYARKAEYLQDEIAKQLPEMLKCIEKTYNADNEITR